MTEWKESDRELGAAPLGPPVSFDSFWEPENSAPGAAGGDKKANNVQVSAMLAQPVYRAMQVLMYRPEFPFKSPSDIVRAAVWHYLRAVHKAQDVDHPYYRDALHREQLRADAEQLAEQHEKLSETLEHTHDQLTALLDSGPAGVAELRRRMDSIHEHESELSEYWRGTYESAHRNMAAYQAVEEILNARNTTPRKRDADDSGLRAGLGHGTDGGVRHDPPGDERGQARPDQLQAAQAPAPAGSNGRVTYDGDGVEWSA